MIPSFCPACWSDTPALVEICPQCGADLGRYLELTVEEKYLLALQHPVSENRIIAAWFLGDLGSKRALPEFERMLRVEKEHDVLREILRTLAFIPGPRARELLTTALAHPYPLISQLAKRYLAENNG